MKKKAIGLVLMMCLVLGLSGCKQNNNSDEKDNESSLISVELEESEMSTVDDVSEENVTESVEESSDEEPYDPYKYFVTGKYDFGYLISNNKCILTKYNGGSSESDKNVVVPEKIAVAGKDYPTAIAAGCFENTQIESLVLPDNITEIPDKMCKDCTNLSKVTFKNVESIGKEAFWQCENLKISFSDINNGDPSKLKKVGERAFGFSGLYGKVIIRPDMELDDGAFQASPYIEEVEIQSGVTQIQYRLFGSCTRIRKITLPDTLEVIGDVAFFQTNCDSVIIPKSVTEMGRDCITTEGATGGYIGSGARYRGAIFGYKGSVAETYAEEYEANFIPLD